MKKRVRSQSPPIEQLKPNVTTSTKLQEKFRLPKKKSSTSTRVKPSPSLETRQALERLENSWKLNSWAAEREAKVAATTRPLEPTTAKVATDLFPRTTTIGDDLTGGKTTPFLTFPFGCGSRSPGNISIELKKGEGIDQIESGE